jgi:peptide deformylase
MIYDLVKDTDPILHQPCQQFDFKDPPMDPFELARNLKETMIAKRGVGLSANQVGIPYKVFVIGDPNDPENILPVFNPRITFQNEDEVLIEEGCLSYPGMFIKIKRPSVVRARYAVPDGSIQGDVFEGIPARVFLHEYDHMEGVTFTSKASRLRLQQAKKQKVKLDRIRERNMRG